MNTDEIIIETASKKRDFFDDVIFPLFDAEKILSETPTLKVATDAMRGLFSCVAMFGACAFLFFGQTVWWPLKLAVVGIGVWTFFYALLAVFHVWAVMLSGVVRVFQYFLGKEVVRRFDNIVIGVVMVPALLVWFGLFALIVESVRHVVQK